MHPRRAISAGDAFQSTSSHWTGSSSSNEPLPSPPASSAAFPRRSLSPENAPERDRPTLARRPDARTGFDERRMFCTTLVRFVVPKRTRAAAVIRHDENALFHALRCRARSRPRSSPRKIRESPRRARRSKTRCSRTEAASNVATTGNGGCVAARARLKLAHLGTKRIRRRGETFRDLRAKFLEVWRETKFPGKSESEAEDPTPTPTRHSGRSSSPSALLPPGWILPTSRRRSDHDVATPRTVSSPSVKTPRAKLRARTWVAAAGNSARVPANARDVSRWGASNARSAPASAPGRATSRGRRRAGRRR